MDSSDIIGLDVGDKRIGVARVSVVARLPEPLTILNATDQIMDDIKKVCQDHSTKKIVVGVPHNMNGQKTAQSTKIIEFADSLQEFLGPDYSVLLIDESLSSVRARERYPKEKYIDDKSASIILEHYLEEHVS